MPDNYHLEYLQELPSDWPRIPIEKLGNIFTGGTPSRNEPSFWGGSIAWLTPGELLELEWKCITKTREYITDLGLANSSAKLLPPGAILVTTRATIGSVAVAGITLCTNQGFKNVVLDDMSDSYFYYYLFSLLAPEMRRLASGSTFDEISRRDFASIIVPRPIHYEQHNIATILDTIDSQIQKTEQLIAKLKQQREGLLQDLLTCGLDEDGELRDPEAHPELFKDSVLGKVPKEWEINTFEHLAFVIDPQPDHRAPAETLNGYPYVGVGDFRTDGSIAFDECRRVSLTAILKQQKNFRIEAGDIIFGKIGTIGQSQLLPTGRIYALSANVVLIKPRENASYVLWLLNSSLVEQQIKIQIHSTSQPAFGIQRIRVMTVPIPPQDEQIRIVAILDAIDNEIRIESSDLAKLKQYKQGLMYDLLTGRVRVGEKQAFQV